MSMHYHVIFSSEDFAGGWLFLSELVQTKFVIGLGSATSYDVGYIDLIVDDDTIFGCDVICLSHRVGTSPIIKGGIPFGIK